MRTTPITKFNLLAVSQFEARALGICLRAGSDGARRVCATGARTPHPRGVPPRGRAGAGRRRRYSKLLSEPLIVPPPSSTSVWPVMNRPASDARKTAAPAMSSGSPMRFSG